MAKIGNLVPLYPHAPDARRHRFSAVMPNANSDINFIVPSCLFSKSELVKLGYQMLMFIVI